MKIPRATFDKLLRQRSPEYAVALRQCVVAEGRDFVELDIHAPAYRQAQKMRTSRGLGDVVERIIHMLRLDRLVRGRRCGCQKRKTFLNRLRLPML